MTVVPFVRSGKHKQKNDKQTNKKQQKQLLPPIFCLDEKKRRR